LGWHEIETLTWRPWFVSDYCLRDALIVIILHFDDLHTLVFVILRTIVDEKTLTTADKGRRCAVTVDVLRVVTCRAAKDAGQEFEDAVDGILLTLVPLASSQSFMPELLIRCLEFVKISRDSLLVALNGRDTTDDGVDVQELGTALTWKGKITIREIGILLAAAFTIFSSDKTEEIGLPSVEIRVLKVPKLCISVALQDALLEVRYLMKSVHVQLSNKRREIPMLEKSWEDIIRKALMLED